MGHVVNHFDILYAAIGALFGFQGLLYLSLLVRVTISDEVLQLSTIAFANVILVLFSSWSIRFGFASSLLADVFVTLRMILEGVLSRGMVATPKPQPRRF